MFAALTVRRLKPDAFDDWRRAWQPEQLPEGVTAYILRNVNDPDEVIAFGLFEGTRADLERVRPDAEAERARQERMAPLVESVGADGIFEVVEIVGARDAAPA